MSQPIRLIGILLRKALQADAARTVMGLLLVILGYVSGPVIALLLREITDAALDLETSRVAILVLGLALTRGLMTVSSWSAFGVRVTLAEKVTFYWQRELMELSAKAKGIRHHEDPQFRDQAELLLRHQGMVSDLLDELFRHVGVAASLCGVVILLYGVHPFLPLVLAFALPHVFLGAVTEKILEASRERIIEKERLAIEFFDLSTAPASAKDMRTLQLEQYVLDRFDQLTQHVQKDRFSSILKGDLLYWLGQSVFSLGLVGAAVLMVLRAISGQVSAGEVLMTLTLLQRVTTDVESGMEAFAWFARLRNFSKRYFQLMDHLTAQFPSSEKIDETSLPATEGISIEGLTFGYPNSSDKAVSNVNLVLPKGKVVALVGENGAGKSTLVKLLCGFYEPENGSVTIGGFPLSRFDVRLWRTNLTAVFQDSFRFEFLLHESVGIGNLARAGDTRFIAGALEAAGAEKLYERLPRGLATQLGARFGEGVDLSTGQWQQVALARALMRDQPILFILDEPTSNLDPLAERSFMERIVRAARDMAADAAACVLLISHRPSTIRTADLIGLIENGRLVQLGSHEELIQKEGSYAQLFAKAEREADHSESRKIKGGISNREP